MADFYKLLRLKQGASIEEIKKAYKKFAFHFHPDRNKEKGDLFFVVQKAYDELIKQASQPVFPAKRKAGKEAYKQPANLAKHDLFFVKATVRKKPAGKNIYMFRVPKVVSDKRMCKNCNGYGVVENRFHLASNCPKCNGSGSNIPDIL